MAAHLLAIAVIFRLFIPLLLAICTAMRFSLTSFFYLILLLINPLLKAPNEITMRGHTGWYLKGFAMLGVFNFLMTLIFQIVLLSIPPYGFFLQPCSANETILRHIGLVRLDAISEEDGTRWLLPECLLLVIGPTCFIVIKKLVAAHEALQPTVINLTSRSPTASTMPPYRNFLLKLMLSVGNPIAVVLIGFAGVLAPSLTSASYFSVFLYVATYWSLNNSLGKRFGHVTRVLTVVSGFHIVLLYIYQAQWVQEGIPETYSAPRAFGLQALYVTKCDGDPRAAYVPRPEWNRFLNPVVLVLLYYFLHYHSRFILSEKAEVLQRQSAGSASVGMKSLIRRHTVMRRSIKRSSTKSSRKRNTSSSTVGNPNSLFLSGKYRRKSSAMSASSAPIPKSPKSSIVLSQRRRSALPEFGVVAHRHLHGHNKHRLSQQYGTIYRSAYHHSNPFSHLPPPKHRRSASTAIRQHLLPPLDRPPAPVPPESDLQINEVGRTERRESCLKVDSGSRSLSRAASAINGRASILPCEVSFDASTLEPRPHSDLNGSMAAWSPSSSFRRRTRTPRGLNFGRNSLQVPSFNNVDDDVESGTNTCRSHFEEDDDDNEDYYEEEDNQLEKIIAQVLSICQLMVRSSYIATNIVMMAWSITYHSWLTFVLLMWACVLWMIPNQRVAMLRCSPFLVIYAELLLVLQYIYSMDLTDEELPSKVESVNMGQIGLLKARKLPADPLIVKILYTSMFWLTLRQYIQERGAIDPDKKTTIAAALQPFSVAVTTSNQGENMESLTSLPQENRPAETPDEQPDSGLSKFGQSIRSLCIKFWIWLVAINLFAFGIQGSKVVIFRIMYMVLFLIFTIVFQVSYSAWRKFLYGFWLTVITYQMLVLVLTYTYQFDHFPEYWQNYTGIPVQLQNDIGLEVYDTGRLFIKLMTPTFFVIVTIIQVHYFHKEFLALSDIEEKLPDTSKVPEKKIEPPEPKPTVAPPKLLESCTLEDLKALLIYVWHHSLWHVHRWTAVISELGWRFLEIHIMKIVLGSVMLLACYDVCALHWIFVLLVTIAVPSNERVQNILCRACVTITSFLLIIRMIYQIEYIDPQGISANCSEMNVTRNKWPLNDTAANNGLWLGFRKTKNLSNYLKGYIGIIVVITVQAVVGIRQQYVRKLTGAPPPPPGVLFNNITRKEADDGLPNCLKFLFNYGFYKFGVEIVLISIVSVIGTRLDFFSILYSGWLLYFYNRERIDMARVWNYFVYSIAVMIPVQYLMSVGIAPTYCRNYPWYDDMNKELREWLFFPDFVKPPESYKIVTDFILLVFAVSQKKVFDIEFDVDGELYDGGSNDDIVHLDPATLYNPLPDFVTYSRTYLDKLKIIIFFSSYWMSLAVMFLCGTNRITVIALGYVIGAFVFLWQGNEFYLHPIDKIMKLWNYLLGYNVTVILIKTFLQLLGCVLLEPLAKDACWFVQLFGIACVKKFWDKSDDDLARRLAEVCAIPKTEAGLMWDGLCFAFLLVQRRLYSSFYFQHLVNEMRAQAQLASRGAELIAERIQRDIQEQQAAEQAVIAKIKEKMERIKASAQKDEEELERQSHFDASCHPFSNASSPLPTELVSPIYRDVSPRSGHYLATPAAPTPSSANMTISLDGYMEPTRLSITTPHLPILQPITSPSEDSFPVFSPPPYPGAPKDRIISSGIDVNHIGPPWLRNNELRRYSAPSLSPSHHAYISSKTGLENASTSLPSFHQTKSSDLCTSVKCDCGIQADSDTKRYSTEDSIFGNTSDDISLLIHGSHWKFMDESSDEDVWRTVSYDTDDILFSTGDIARKKRRKQRYDCCNCGGAHGPGPESCPENSSDLPINYTRSRRDSHSMCESECM